MNVSLEVEASIVNTVAFVSNADQKERMTIADRKFVDNKLRSIIDLRNAVGEEFLIVNQKGIDGPSMDILARANISALRRVSKKMMDKFIHACNCKIVNCVDDLEPQSLGKAGSVIEKEVKDMKFVYVDEVEDPRAVAIVVGGMNDMTSGLVIDAINDGLRAVKHAFQDNKILPGAGATEISLNARLHEFKKSVPPMMRVGVEVYAEALLSLPRALLRNAGLDASEIIGDMQTENDSGFLAGVDLETGEVMDPTVFGIYDTYCVKRSIIQSSPLVASQLLLVDEIITAGAPMSGQE